jgi:hypothetical protein
VFRFAKLRPVLVNLVRQNVGKVDGRRLLEGFENIRLQQLLVFQHLLR